jgi:hypothetical protein
MEYQVITTSIIIIIICAVGANIIIVKMIP